MTREYLFEADELAEGEHRVVSVDGGEIGVFRIEGSFHAYTNRCPHQGGPVCEGSLGGTAVANYDRDRLRTAVSWDRDGRILTCPWHSWEFDATTGACLSRPDRRLRAHEIVVEDGSLFLRR